MARPKPKRPYGEGSLTRDGDRWRIRWRQNGQRQSETHPTYDLAMAALRVINGELARGRARLDPDPKHTPRLSILAEAWFDQREGPHNRNNGDDRRKWKNHLEPEIGHLRPDELTAGRLVQLINDKRQSGRIRRRKGDTAGLSNAMVKQLIAILSSLYTHLNVTERATTFPTKKLPPDIKRKMVPDYDWRNRPYLKVKGDVRRVFAALSPPFNVAYAIGVMRGLRPGEIRALAWPQVDLEARLLHVERQVRNGKLGLPKGGKARTVTISEDLYSVLAPWRLKTGGHGLVIPPRRRGKRVKWISEKAFNRELGKALSALGLSPLEWYEATKHTFASHWVRDHGSLETLRIILGHSSTDITRRYAHLQSDQLRPEDTARAQFDLRPGTVVPFGPAVVHRDSSWAEIGTEPGSASEGGTRDSAKVSRKSGP